MLAVCCLGMTIGCGTNPSKNENVKETLPALVVNGTQLMNTEGDMTWVKFMGFDEKGRANFSRKDALKEMEGNA